MKNHLEKAPSKTCLHCGAPIGRVHVNLHRNEERLAKPGTTGNHLDMANDRILKSYCMKCGVKTARADLEKLGFVCHDVTDYESTRFCTSCGRTPIDMYEWHATYLIAVNCFVSGRLDTAEETVVVIACAGCEARHGPLRTKPLGWGYDAHRR